MHGDTGWERVEVVARIFNSHFCLEKQRKDYADYRLD